MKDLLALLGASLALSVACIWINLRCGASKTGKMLKVLSFWSSVLGMGLAVVTFVVIARRVLL